MTQILAFIVAHMGFLWSGARFKIVDSDVTTSNGGDALLVVESAVVRMRIIRDRGQLFLDIEPVANQESEWCSIDLVRRLFLGHRESSAVLDGSYADFVREYLDQIEERFSPDNWDATHQDIKALKVQRSREMFGKHRRK